MKATILLAEDEQAMRERKKDQFISSPRRAAAILRSAAPDGIGRRCT